MTQIFSDGGDEIPVTVLEMGPCFVSQVKTNEKDGYSAAQLAFEPIEKKNKKKLSKPAQGLFDKAKIKPHRYLREFKLDSEEEVKVGDTVKVDMFDGVDFVSITGMTKGKGFAGVVKRYRQKGQSATRGSHEHFRHPGSIGMSEFPGRVFKGKHMPGHMGAINVKVLNLEVVKIFAEKNLLLVRGAAPGANGGIVIVTPTKRRRKKAAVVMEPKKKKGGR